MPTVVNIRGGNASGKSWVARQVLAWGKPVAPVMSARGRIEGYPIHDDRAFVLGKYGDSNTGGADTFKDLADVEDIILRQTALGRHVLFEGIRVHAGHSRWIEFAKRNPQLDHEFIILDTSPQECERQMVARRLVAGNDKPLTAAQIAQIDDYYRRGVRQLNHFASAGLSVRHVNSQYAVGMLQTMLGGK